MIWLPEGLVWAGKRIPWLVLVNPLEREQVVQVDIIGRPAFSSRHTVAARGRLPIDLGSLGAQDAFAVEVHCDPTCAASLVSWDPAYERAHISPMVVGCEVTP